MSLDLTDSADFQTQECQSSFVLVAFICLLIYFTSFYSYCDIAICDIKVFGVGIVLIYTLHLMDTKRLCSAVFSSINVVFLSTLN